MFSKLRAALRSLTQPHREQRKARPPGRRLNGVEQLENRQLMAGVPEFSSLPEAEVTIYLDFDGHYEAEWGAIFDPDEGIWHDVTTPVFSTDANDEFSPQELQMIEKIWRCVAEDYAPFQVNVTTVEPAEFEFGSGLRVAIGGKDEDWYQGDAGGVAQLRSYSVPALVNTVYVFSEDFWQVNAPRMIADAASHEAGHAFGLSHQSLKVDGVEIAEYHPGDAFQAPLMGVSYNSARSLWWRQEWGGAVQDDMKNLNDPLAGSYGISFRTDDHGGTAATATPIDSIDAPLHGVITSNAWNEEQGDDVDAFTVHLPENALLKMWSISVNVDSYAANLDARLEVYKLGAKFPQLVGQSDPSNGLGATVQFEGGGEYLIKVMSHGGYGDLGQYAVQIGQTSILLRYEDWFTREPLIDIVCDPLLPVQILSFEVRQALEIDRPNIVRGGAVGIFKSPAKTTGLADQRDADSQLDAGDSLHDLALLEILKEFK